MKNIRNNRKSGQAIVEYIKILVEVASAGLDSFAVEPMRAPHPFHGEPRITLSPHIGGVTADAYVKMGVGAAKNALAVLNG